MIDVVEMNNFRKPLLYWLLNNRYELEYKLLGNMLVSFLVNIEEMCDNLNLWFELGKPEEEG
jgi:hypothetical protein